MPISDADLYSYVDAHAHSYVYGYRYFHAYSYRDRFLHALRADSHRDGNLHANINTDADRYPDADCSARKFTRDRVVNE